MTEGWRAPLRDALRAGQRIGAVGPGDLDEQIDHSLAFVGLIPAETRRAMDLGTGGGLPGLALAGALPEVEWVLVDAAARRVRVVEAAVDELGWQHRVEVVHGRAEQLGADDRWRDTCQVVTARSFGPPAVVAECARPFLVDGGRLVVAEPPPDVSGAALRWPAEGVAGLGYELGDRVGEPSLQVLVATGSCPAGLPRRVGAAAKRPRW